MSIQSVVGSEGHGAFYTLIGLSLAVLLYPFYQELSFITETGLSGPFDSAILILGATGVITGIFYTISVDQFIDRIVEYKVRHQPRSGKLHYLATRKINNELIMYISGVDFLSSTWRTPSWISIEDSCDSAVQDAIKDHSIQKELWSLKNKSVVGFVFLVWGFAFIDEDSRLFLLSVVAIITGMVFLLVPWMFHSSTSLPTIIRQVAVIQYAEDAISNWRPLGDESIRKSVMKRLAEDTTRAQKLITNQQWDRVNRFYSWLTNLLEKYNRVGYVTEERILEIWARAMIDIESAKSRKKPVGELVTKYLSALDVFTKCGENKLPEWAKKLEDSDLSNLAKFLERPNSWNRVDAYYGDFHHVIFDVFEELSDKKKKVAWTNALVHPSIGLAQENLKTLFHFACTYEGSDISLRAYDLFVTGGSKFLPYEEVTITFVDKLVSLTNPALEDYDVNLSRTIFGVLLLIAKKSNVKKEVRERIICHVEKNSQMKDWFEKNIGINWKDKLKALG